MPEATQDKFTDALLTDLQITEIRRNVSDARHRAGNRITGITKKLEKLPPGFTRDEFLCYQAGRLDSDFENGVIRGSAFELVKGFIEKELQTP